MSNKERAPENETLSVQEAGRVLGLGREAAYRAAQRGQIPTLVFGDNTLRVPIPALRRLLEGNKN